YANIDGFTGQEAEIAVAQRPDMDRWILSELNTLIARVTECLDNYDPTPAARAIQTFVCDNLSNWHVRLNRKRFWGGGLTQDKLAAYQTLYTCLETVAKLSAPFAPFISDRIYRDLNAVSGRNAEKSVHLSSFPVCDSSLIDTDLEQTTAVAQQLSSMVLALRRKVNIKVRQPLAKIIIPVLDAELERRTKAVEALVASEVNVKSVELIHDTAGIITKRIKPNFKTLGPKYGKYMKAIQALVATFDQAQIAAVECGQITTLDVAGETIVVTAADFDITSEDMPGWLVASEGKLTVALDITVTPELEREGVARELVNRIQNIRKESGLEIVDKIRVEVEDCDVVREAVAHYADYICQQTLAVEVTCVQSPEGLSIDKYNEVNDTPVKIAISKI
ncbi:MAG: class I tRNA ligase family protein, partial [Alistipes sp.]|nr:class I tRNA ligase family protein [Alistipes sp.]